MVLDWSAQRGGKREFSGSVSESGSAFEIEEAGTTSPKTDPDSDPERL